MLRRVDTVKITETPLWTLPPNLGPTFFSRVPTEILATFHGSSSRLFLCIYRARLCTLLRVPLAPPDACVLRFFISSYILQLLWTLFVLYTKHFCHVYVLLLFEHGMPVSWRAIIREFELSSPPYRLSSRSTTRHNQQFVLSTKTMSFTTWCRFCSFYNFKAALKTTALQP